jgi:branched-chain amino acid transport system ATP-binding protein
MTFVMGLCDKLYVLDFGVLIAKGRPDEVRTNPAVLDAYLGQVA